MNELIMLHTGLISLRLFLGNALIITTVERMPEDAIENVTKTCPFLLIQLLVVSSRLHSIQFLDFKCGSDNKKCYAYFSSFLLTTSYITLWLLISI